MNESNRIVKGSAAAARSAIVMERLPDRAIAERRMLPSIGALLAFDPALLLHNFFSLALPGRAVFYCSAVAEMVTVRRVRRD